AARLRDPPQLRIRWRKLVLFAGFSLVVFILLFNTISEWFFWQEYSSRYNFIAVDYLIYTTEVWGNIKESYPLTAIVSIIALLTAAIVYANRKSVVSSVLAGSPFILRSKHALWILALPLCYTMFVSEKWRHFSHNEYVNSIAGNGLFEFAFAFKQNELNFYKYYQTVPDSTAFRLVKADLEQPGVRFIGKDTFSIEREINYPEPEQKLNVVMISVESLSADFMAAFGNKNHITPNLDSLAEHSLLFTNLYASGTRTVRGLESLALSIPPTPGQSTVKRPDNAGLFSLGSVFRSKGYTAQYIYGGYSYFDNMKSFFSSNGYEVIDRSSIAPKNIHYENVWGVADEDLFSLALEKLDSNAAKGKPFFTQIMTVSNHRPYTYPADRIDIPPSTQTRDGAVKYTDYAIGRFLKEAAGKPWFSNTIFVIVADHCASSAGSVELPVNAYHIPMLIYAPALLQARHINTLTAQVDIAPTILGLLKFHYRSKFFGKDIFQPSANQHAFISTYQGLGFVQNGELIIQSPVRQVKEQHPNPVSGDAIDTPVNESLAQLAISYYQCASWLLMHGRQGF
ncbi:MAG: alkaline phosphatase family protein, partial [Chitinophagaceae bacterium]